VGSLVAEAVKAVELDLGNSFSDPRRPMLHENNDAIDLPLSPLKYANQMKSRRHTFIHKPPLDLAQYEASHALTTGSDSVHVLTAHTHLDGLKPNDSIDFST
jgi:hypothetical protein